MEEEGITAKRSGGMIRQLETTNTPCTAVLNVPDIFLFGNLFSPTTPSMVRKQGRETVIRALSHYFRPSLYFKSTLDLKAQVHFFLKRFLSLTVCNGRNELVGMPPKRLFCLCEYSGMHEIQIQSASHSCCDGSAAAAASCTESMMMGGREN